MKIDLLHRHAAELGVRVEWHDLGSYRRGDYCDDLLLIRLNTRLTRTQAVSTFAHEVAHAIYRDRVSSEQIEARADAHGASLVIEPWEYAAAEALVGCHAGALAVELEVTPRMVTAWRRWYAARADSSHLAS